jgi:endoglucanase
MKMVGKLRLCALALGCLVAAACGGGGGGGAGMGGGVNGGSPPPPPPPPTITAVQANQVGFRSDGAHRAVVVSNSASPLDWSLLNASNTSVANGQTQRFGLNAGSGQVVHSIDFSAFTTPGAGYVLDVSGVRSHPFDIGGDVYDQLKYDALAFFYHQRASIAIEAQYVGATWARPVAHDPDAGGCIAIDFRGNDWGGCPYTLDVSRGWYDAGDQGKYVVNGGIAV